MKTASNLKPLLRGASKLIGKLMLSTAISAVTAIRRPRRDAGAVFVRADLTIQLSTLEPQPIHTAARRSLLIALGLRCARRGTGDPG